MLVRKRKIFIQFKQIETQTRKEQEKKRVTKERDSGRRAVFGYICFMCGCDTALECIGPEYSSPGFGRNTGMFRSIAALIRQRCKPTRLPPSTLAATYCTGIRRELENTANKLLCFQLFSLPYFSPRHVK